jgi:hypothetical protein
MQATRESQAVGRGNVPSLTSQIGHVLHLHRIKLNLQLLILSNSRWVAHRLEHTHNTLQGLYIEL